MVIWMQGEFLHIRKWIGAMKGCAGIILRACAQHAFVNDCDCSHCRAVWKAAGYNKGLKEEPVEPDRWKRARMGQKRPAAATPCQHPDCTAFAEMVQGVSPGETPSRAKKRARVFCSKGLCRQV